MAYTTINKSSDYFNTKLWSGNGSSQALTGVGHQTDMVWIKSRTDTRKHNLYDVVRGVQKRIVPNDSVAEDTVTGVTAFGADGFTVGSETDTNGSSRNFVGWSWKAGTTSGITTNGSTTITPTAYSFNATAGFSIIKYVGNGTTGAKYPHGLGVAPKMVIVKNLGTSDWWNVHHASLGNNNELYLNTTNAAPGSTGNGTTPDAVNIELEGTTNTHNASGNNYIAYCFAEKQGFSKFGSYVGNGSTDGTFVYTGFKPAFAMFKDTTSARDWTMLDNKRNTFNVMDKRLFPNNVDAESDTDILDFTSNGIKLRSTNTSVNASGNTYIFMVFAEAPLVGTNGVTAKAR